MDKTRYTQSSITRLRIRLQGNLIPEAKRLLGLNLADENRVELREDLDHVKDQLQDRMSWIREEFKEWMVLIKEYGDEERRQLKEEAFHRFRLEGTDACPGDLEELFEEVEHLILAVGLKINRIMNAVPVRPPNPVPAVVPAPISAAVVADQIPDITSKTHEKETRERKLSFIFPRRVLTEKFEEINNSNRTEDHLKENSTNPVMEYGGRAFVRIEERFQWATTDLTSMVMESSTQLDRKSHKKLRKENLNPGEVESVMKCKGRSSVRAGDKFRWVRIALPKNPRKKRHAETKETADSGNDQKKSWTNFTRHWKYGRRSQRQRKQRKSSSVSELPGQHRMNKESDEKNKKENLDPGIRTLNGHASLFRPGMSWIVPNYERKGRRDQTK